jgi:hypothetical protein
MSSVLPSLWPESAGPGSTVVSCRINRNVDEVFHSIWIDQALAVRNGNTPHRGSYEGLVFLLQALLHKTRSDSNFFESEWTHEKEDLPKTFTDWNVVKSGNGENIKDFIATHRYRKVSRELQQN